MQESRSICRYACGTNTISYLRVRFQRDPPYLTATSLRSRRWGCHIYGKIRKNDKNNEIFSQKNSKISQIKNRLTIWNAMQRPEPENLKLQVLLPPLVQIHIHCLIIRFLNQNFKVLVRSRSSSYRTLALEL